MEPILYLIIPCYNEEKVLPITSKLFLEKIKKLIKNKEISEDSKIVFVNDGSNDSTYQIIEKLSSEHKNIEGISLSRNRGHQNALLCGLLETKDKCDISISIDCDGQDDINAIDEMIKEYKKGNEIVYGVRKSRKKDTFFKRNTALAYYKLLQFIGIEIIYNHADYRLLSSKVLNHLNDYKEVNLFLRGIIPLIGFKYSCVYYDRNERISGKSHYPLKKMLLLAFDGITSLSIQPIRIIMSLGIIISIFSVFGIIWAIVKHSSNDTTWGWSSLISFISFFGGLQLFSTGIIGEYIGKIYLETKQRPRYIVDKTTFNKYEKH